MVPTPSQPGNAARPFRTDRREHQREHAGLLRGEELVPLRRKSYEILLLLVERSGELIEKDELLRVIWPDQIIEETNLAQHIYRLRQALGDNPKAPDYILTVPGKGYIFNHNLRLIEGGSDSQPPAAPDPEVQLQEETVPDQTVAKSGRRRLPRWPPIAGRWVPLILVSVAVTAGIGLPLRGRFTRTATSPAPRIRPFVTLPGQESHPAFSPDGKYIAFSSEGETPDNQDLYVKMVDQDVLWRVTSHPDKDTHVVWSPDGSRLAFLRQAEGFTRQYKLMIVPVRGGGEEEIAEVWGGLDWSPDGRYLAVADYEGLGTATGICLISLEDRQRTRLTNQNVSYYDTYPRFSPDGRQIAFIRWQNGTSSDVYLLTLGSGQLRQLTFDQKRIPDLQWDPNGEGIYFISNREENNRLWRVPVGGGAPELLARAPVDLENISLSPTGEILAFTQSLNDTVIDLFDISTSGRDGQGPAPVRACTINSSRGDDTPRFSPDGSRIAFVSNRTGWEEIWIASRDCSNAWQLTYFQQLGVGSPRWSPDGESIVFDRHHEGNTDIFTIRADGTALRRLTTDGAIENMPSWSADGKWIYFGSYKTGISTIYRIPAGGGEVVQVTSGRGREPIAAADGKSLYYTSGDRIWRKDLEGDSEAMVRELAETPVGRYWDLVGSELIYIPQAAGEKPVVRSFNLTTRRNRLLAEVPGSLSRWVPGISLNQARNTLVQNRLAVSYVTSRLGDISLVRRWK